MPSVEELQQQLEQERAYSKMLEVNIRLKVEEQLDEVAKEAESRGFQRGVSANPNGMAAGALGGIRDALEKELNDKLPQIIDDAIPNQYKPIIRDGLRPRVHVEAYQKPNDFSTRIATRVTIPETHFTIDHLIAGY